MTFISFFNTKTASTEILRNELPESLLSVNSVERAWLLDAGARRNRQVRTSTRTLRPATREVAQRAQRHACVLRAVRAVVQAAVATS
jgi:hypothetical protein